MGRGSGKTRQERSSSSKRAFPEGQGQTKAAVSSRAEFADERSQALKLLEQEPLKGLYVPVLVLTGSRAYGFADSESDIDFRGIYIAPTEECLGLSTPEPRLERIKPDLVVYEIAKFCWLAQAANPNVLEFFWAPEMQATDIWQQLREQSSLFVSQRVRESYSGFAHAQLKKMLKAEAAHPERTARREKRARHIFRLFEQGQQLLTSGELQIKVADPAELVAWAKAPASEIEKRFHELDATLQALPSSLPEEADLKAIEELLRSIRLQLLGL